MHEPATTMKIRKAAHARIAVFQDEDYDRSLERQLAAEGFFAVAIRDPKPADIEAYPEYILAPEWVRWVMPTPATPEEWLAALGSGHDRYKLRKKLRLSAEQRDDIRVDIAPLTVSDYTDWYRRLYLPEIGGKIGGILYWPRPEAMSGKFTVTAAGEVADFFRIFLFDGGGNCIGGALWSVDSVENSLTTRAAAFEKKARARYQLAIRAMEESRCFALSLGLNWLSYGTDLNLYGLDGGLGLQSFKASIGMKPVLARVGTVQLIRILDRGLSQIHTVADDRKPSVLIFSLGGNDLRQKAAAYERIPPRKSRGRLDLLWRHGMDLVPLRLVVDPRTDAVNVPRGMVLHDIVLETADDEQRKMPADRHGLPDELAGPEDGS